MYKNREPLSVDPTKRMGVYTSIEDVPKRNRLESQEGVFHGRDVRGEFYEYKTARNDAKSTIDRYEKAGRYLTEFMEERDRHHALMHPDDVEAFLAGLRNGDIGRFGRTRNMGTVYFEYFQPLDNFYEWLQWHTEYPHVYNPVRMAVVQGGIAAEAWEEKNGDASRPMSNEKQKLADAFGRERDPLEKHTAKFDSLDVDVFELFLDDVLRPQEPAEGTFKSDERTISEWAEFMEEEIGDTPPAPTRTMYGPSLAEN